MNVLLRRALESGEVLEMIYISDKGEISQRRVKVLGISDSSITAYCMLRNKRRTFKLANILSIMPIRKRHKVGA